MNVRLFSSLFSKQLIKTLSAVICTLLALTAVAQTKKDEFVLIRHEGAVNIYERWITFPGSDPPVIAREVKCEFPIQGPIYEMLHILKDEGNIKVWQRHVSEFKAFPQKDTTFWLEYSYHDIPWPVSDQDHFLEYKLTEVRPGEELFVTFKSRPDAKLAPIQKNVTRMILAGSWTMERISDTESKITYRILSMPIGIPRLFTDPVIRSNLMSTIQELVKLAESLK